MVCNQLYDKMKQCFAMKCEEQFDHLLGQENISNKTEIPMSSDQYSLNDLLF
jgi:hypothetical protein